MPREGRKRRRHQDEQEEERDDGEVVISSEEGEAAEDDEDLEDVSGSEGDEDRRRRSKKKAKKTKKAKKKKKKKHRHRHRDSDEESDEGVSARKRARRRRSGSAEGEEEAGDTEEDEAGRGASTDGEGGSTPELREVPQLGSLEKPTVVSAAVAEEEEEEREGRSQRRARRRRTEEEGEIRESRESRESRSPQHKEESSTRRHRDRDREPGRRGEEENGHRDRDGGRRRRHEESRERRGREDERRGSRRTRSRSPIRKEQAEEVKQEQPKEEPAESAVGGGGGGATISLSIEETNKLRASLGLKPLKVEGQGGEAESKEAEEERQRAEAHAVAMGGTLIPDSKKNEVHIPAENWSDKTQADKIREKIKQRRLKREQESKLLKIRTLGESDSDEEGGGAANWVEKHRKVQQAKKDAEKRAKMLEELDDEFGVGSIVDEEAKKEKSSSYGGSALSGLTVEHDATHFKEGQSVILTLKDADVLDDDASDTLVNVNMADDDHTRKKLDDAKKARVGYNAYDMEEVDDLTGELKKKNMLDKYDEEIDGEVRKSFKIGRGGKYSAEEEMERERKRIREKLEKMKSMTLESLDTGALKVASDYMTREEADAKFKKPKKKKKKVKKSVLKADDLLDGAEESFGSRNRRAKAAEEEEGGGLRQVGGFDDDEDDALNIRPNLVANVKVEDEDDEDSVAEKARKMREAKAAAAAARRMDLGAERILQEVKSEPIKTEADEAGSEFIPSFEDDDRAAPASAKQSSFMILNETAEFCRNLGSRQMSLELERNRRRAKDRDSEAVDDDLLEFEDSLKSSATRQHEERRGRWEEVNTGGDDMDIDTDEEEDGSRGGWRTVDANASTSQPSTSSRSRTAILEEEPDLQQGVAAAIQVASRKGYFDKQESKSGGQGLAHLKAKNYTIDDKVRDREDDRGGRGRERYGGGGSMQPFAEKQGWRPDVKLEYIDDNGRMMSSKEAFRYLSHKFHGKGSGKMKSEKRMKKVMEEALVKNMLSTDTPLQTLEKLKKKQAETSTPYLVLTGNKMNPQDIKK